MTTVTRSRRSARAFGGKVARRTGALGLTLSLITGLTVSVTSPVAASSSVVRTLPTSLSRGSVLLNGQSLRSNSGSYVATLTANGQLAVTHNGSTSWVGGRSDPSSTSSTLTFQSSGNVTVRTSSGIETWSTNTSSTDASRLLLTNVGTLKVLSSTGTTLWTSGPQSGRSARVIRPHTPPVVYTPEEFFGGANPSATCFTCQASIVTSSAPPSNSLNSGGGVNTLTGDFSTSLKLFSASAVGPNLAVTLTYDAQHALEQHASGGPGQFGYGWSSNLVASMNPGRGGGSQTVNLGSGAQLNFGPSSLFRGNWTCPLGDQAPIRYTVTTGWFTSANHWCALANVQGQFGDQTANSYMYIEQGGKYVEQFGWTGAPSTIGTYATYATGASNEVYAYNVAPGSYPGGYTSAQRCPTTATSCTAVLDPATRRDVVEAFNVYGMVAQVIDPSGVTYNFTYDSNWNLITVTKFANQPVPSTWNYVYDNSSSNLLIQVYDPDSGVSSPASSSPGAAHSNSLSYNYGTKAGMVASETDGTGATTTYSYQYPCGTGQCLGAASPQVTTVTYPAQVPCPSCAAVSPVQTDTYGAGVQSAMTLGSTTNAHDSETWGYSWTLGYGTGPSTETVTYPHTLSGTAATATIVLDAAGNRTSTTDPLGHVATTAYNDTGSDPFNNIAWSYPGASSNPPSSPPSGSYSYQYWGYSGELAKATNPLGVYVDYVYYAVGGELCFVAPPNTYVSAQTICSGSGAASWANAPVGSNTYAYDTNGDVVASALDYNDTAAGADPQTTTASYNAMGSRLWSIPAAGQSGSQSSSNPYATVTSYTPANLPLATTVPGRGTSTNTYDAALNLVQVATPISGLYQTNVYDADNRPCYELTSWMTSGFTCASASQAGSTRLTYLPGSPNVATSTDANNLTTTNYYGELAHPNSVTEVVDPTASMIQYTAHNDLGDACVSGSVAMALGTATQCATLPGDTSTATNLLNKPTSVTDPSGNVTSYAYTNASYPTLVTSTTNALNAVTASSYDAAGQLVQTTNPDGSIITQSYDNYGRECVQADNGSTYACGAGTGVNGVTQYAYNGASERTAMTSYNPTQTTSYGFANGQMTSVTDANAKTVRYLYAIGGQIACIAYPVSATSSCGTLSAPATGSLTNTIVTHAYDGAGRLTGVTDWLANTTAYNYNVFWTPYSPSSIVYPASTGLTTSMGYDNNGQINSLSTGSAINDSWRYDANERIAVTTVNGSASGWASYNANNQITGATNLATSTSNDAYTMLANGSITSDTAPSGNVNSYGYNAGGELCWSASVSSSSSACGSAPSRASIASSYTYSTNGQRASTATTVGAVNAVGSLAQSQGTGNSTVSVNSANVGDALLLSINVGSSSVTVSSVTGGGATWTKVTSGGTGRDLELWLGKVTSSGPSTITVAYSGSVTSTSIELASQEFTNGTGSATTWTTDATGSSSSSTATSTVAFPSLSASGTGELYLASAWIQNTGSAGTTSGFTYDVTGLQNLITFNPNASGTLSPTAVQSPAGTYQSVAVLLKATAPSTATTNYAWNPYGQLCNAATTATACGSTPSTGTTYAYNAYGLRTNTVVTSGGSSTSSTATAWDTVGGGTIPLNLNDAVTSGSTTTNTSYIYGDLLFGGTAPVEQITGSSATFLVANQTGVQGVFSASGATLETALYSTYGVTTITSGTNATPFGFQGSYSDPTGLIYLINRYYDPTTDQFLSIDPAVAQTHQPYVYTGDNPLNSTDPLGLGTAANNALTQAISSLAAWEKAEAHNPNATNAAAVKALEQRVASDAQIVNSENAAAVLQATGGNVTQVPSLVASSESQQRNAYACEQRATGTIVKGGITGGLMAAGGATTDFFAIFDIVIAPAVTGLVIIVLGMAIIVGSAGYGIYQSSQC